MFGGCVFTNHDYKIASVIHALISSEGIESTSFAYEREVHFNKYF